MPELTGYPARMQCYLREMFPVGRHLLLAFVMYLAVAAFARRLHDTPSSVWSFYVVLGTWSYFAVLLMLRLMDELKDKDIDAQLFPDRPLPSGRVLESDIRLSLSVTLLAYLGSNAIHPQTLIAATVIAGYAVLMFKRFFLEKQHCRSLPLTLATHNPIVPLSIAYGFSVFAAEHRLGIQDLAWQRAVPFVGLLWMPLLGWELSRKIRAPQDEDEYVTYSQLLGIKGAVGAVLLVQLAGITLGIHLCYLGILPGSFLVLPVIAWFWMLRTCVRFARSPDPGSGALRTGAEIYVFTVLISVLISLREYLK